MSVVKTEIHVPSCLSLSPPKTQPIPEIPLYHLSILIFPEVIASPLQKWDTEQVLHLQGKGLYFH